LDSLSDVVRKVQGRVGEDDINLNHQVVAKGC
jgi:hypothetical protein